jgi:hypothetical protein
MADMNRRLNAIEKRLGTHREAKIYPPAIIGAGPSPEDERNLGPVETWITYQEQLKAQEEANTEHIKDHPGCLPKVIVLSLDANEEYARRSERKCMT